MMCVYACGRLLLLLTRLLDAFILDVLEGGITARLQIRIFVIATVPDRWDRWSLWVSTNDY